MSLLHRPIIKEGGFLAHISVQTLPKKNLMMIRYLLKSPRTQRQERKVKILMLTYRNQILRMIRPIPTIPLMKWSKSSVNWRQLWKLKRTIVLRMSIVIVMDHRLQLPFMTRWHLHPNIHQLLSLEKDFVSTNWGEIDDFTFHVKIFPLSSG